MELKNALKKFNNIFGEFKEYKEGKMELTTQILAISDKSDKKRSFKLEIDGQQVWASFWYSSSSGVAPPSVVEVVKSLNMGDEATFDLRKNGNWWNINSIMPTYDVQSDSPEKQIQEMVDEQPTGKSRKVEFNTKQVQVSSYDKCNAMNASVALMVVIFDKHPEMPEEDLFEMHKGFIDRVKIGAENILDDYHGK